LRATVEGLKLGEGVIDRSAEEFATVWDVLSLQASNPVLIAFYTIYALQLLTPAPILAQLAGGRSQIEPEDIGGDDRAVFGMRTRSRVSNLEKECLTEGLRHDVQTRPDWRIFGLCKSMIEFEPYLRGREP
jgi:hypothetical protein